jgi:hypothetical protein
MSLFDLQAIKSVLSDEGFKKLVSDKCDLVFSLVESYNDEGPFFDPPPLKEIPQTANKNVRDSLKSENERLQSLADLQKHATVLGFAAFFRTLDIPVVGNIVDDDGRVFWFTLNKQFLSHVNGEIILKYCGEVPGYWNIDCIIDQAPSSPTAAPSNELEQIIHALHDIRNGLFKVEYMVSPLTIYRNLN